MLQTAPTPHTEIAERFDCFGATVTIMASGAVAPEAVGRAREIAEEIQLRLTCFDRASELSMLNDDPRERVPASRLLRRFAATVRRAGLASGGLVDATCGAGAAGGWADVRVAGSTVIRPRGMRLDSGGLAKGLAADLMSSPLAYCDAWLVDCCGDLRVGGRAGSSRRIDVAGPREGDDVLHHFHLTSGAVATSGTTRRARPGEPHHLIDPRTGRPSDTGVVQVTARAVTGVEAEIRAKAALLAGPRGAAAWLPEGGVVVHADGTVEVMA